MTEVETAQPTVTEVVDYEQFTGQADAILRVQVRSRVTGYLLKKNFLDGEEVREGDLLYEIDDRPYKAALDSARAKVAQGEAHRARLEADFRRATNLYRGGNIGREEFDLISSNYSEAQASLNASKAQLDSARLNFDFTKIRSPMNGQLSRTLVDPGNLIVEDKTLLNDIVMGDKLYVNFDINEESMERVRNLISQGLVGGENGKEVPVEVGTSDDFDRNEDARKRLEGLEDVERVMKKVLKAGKFPYVSPTITYKSKKEIEAALQKLSGQVQLAREKLPKEFPYKGVVNFTENKLDAATGTLRIRGVIDNPRPAILSPGLFVRVHLPHGEPHPTVLVRDDVIGSNQGRTFVYVVDRENDVEYRAVELGALHNGLRAIKTGLKPGEWIINDAEVIRRVRPGSRVAPFHDPLKREPVNLAPKTASR